MDGTNSRIDPVAALPAHSSLAASPDPVLGLSCIGPPSFPGALGTLDRFDLLRRIGEGGMGLVYLARDPDRAVPVAIKILKPELAQDRRVAAYFLKEAQHAHYLVHPHIVPVLEFKETIKGAYLVMPFLTGGNLGQRLQSASSRSETPSTQILSTDLQMEAGRPPATPSPTLPPTFCCTCNKRLQDPLSAAPPPALPDPDSGWVAGDKTPAPALAPVSKFGFKPAAVLSEEVIGRIAKDIAEALLHAHEHGIIHRDLKPSNILLDEQDRAFLADFGLARSLLNDALLDVRQCRWEGTVHYLSPAVAQGHQEDTRGDIYSFGAVLYEMLTGQPPYRGKSRDAVIAQILAGPPRPIREMNPEAPADLVVIAEGAMARELCDRYASMSYVVEDLQRVIREESPLGPHGEGASRSGQDAVQADAITGQQLPSTVAVTTPSTKTAPANISNDLWLRIIGLKRRSMLLLGLVVGLANLGGLWALFKPAATVNYSEKSGLSLVQKITLPGVWNLAWSQSRLADVNLDGRMEFLLTVNNRLVMISPQGHILREWTFPDPLAMRGTILDRTDVNGDGLLETCLSWYSEKTPIISIANDQPFEVKRFNLGSYLRKTDSGEVIESSIPLAKPMDLNGDGKMELLFTLG